MSTPDAEYVDELIEDELAEDGVTLDELIEDCDELPASLHTSEHHDLPRPRAARWSVNDSCVAAVADLDDYV